MIEKILVGIILIGLVTLYILCTACLPANIESLEWNQPFRFAWSVPLWRHALLYQAGALSCGFLAIHVLLLANPPRQFAVAWRPGKLKRSFGGDPRIVWLVPLIGPVAVYVATWFTVTAVVVAFVIAHLLIIVGLQPVSMVIDEHGVIWDGKRFRWEQVRAWRSVHRPGSLDGETSDSYELVVEVENCTLCRDDKYGTDEQCYAKLFRQFVPEQEVVDNQATSQT